MGTTMAKMRLRSCQTEGLGSTQNSGVLSSIHATRLLARLLLVRVGSGNALNTDMSRRPSFYHARPASGTVVCCAPSCPRFSPLLALCLVTIPTTARIHDTCHRYQWVDSFPVVVMSLPHCSVCWMVVWPVGIHSQRTHRQRWLSYDSAYYNLLWLMLLLRNVDHLRYDFCAIHRTSPPSMTDCVATNSDNQCDQHSND